MASKRATIADTNFYVTIPVFEVVLARRAGARRAGAHAALAYMPCGNNGAPAGPMRRRSCGACFGYGKRCRGGRAARPRRPLLCGRRGGGGLVGGRCRCRGGGLAGGHDYKCIVTRRRRPPTPLDGKSLAPGQGVLSMAWCAECAPVRDWLAGMRRGWGRPCAMPPPAPARPDCGRAGPRCGEIKQARVAAR